jgi:hypothetical protein
LSSCHPTPILKGGRHLGAVNILVDITDVAQAHDLWLQAD